MQYWKYVEDLGKAPGLIMNVCMYKLEAICMYVGTGVADMSLARPGKKQATATEDFDFDISYL